MNPFDGLTEKEKQNLIENLNAHLYSFVKGEEILTTISGKNIIGIILEGNTKLILNNYKGEEILIEEYKKDSIFGTYICDINNVDSKMYAQNTTNVLIIDYNILINDSLNQKEWYNRFIKNLFKILILRIGDYNYRLRILSKKTIRDRLIEFFNIERETKHSKTFMLRMPLKDLADYLSVNRSAMFRELKYLKEDNILTIYNRKVTLLYD